MNLDQVNAKVPSKPDRHRVGRGPGSGWGCTAGRGNKGAQSRSGYKSKLHFDGGQMSFIRRIPKRGFTNARFRREWSFVNLKDLNQFADGDVVTPEACLERGIIPRLRAGLKILGTGTLERKLTVKAHRASKTAAAAIEAAGGTLELLPAPGDTAKQRWKEKRGKGKSTQRRQKARARQQQ
ncbi:MAG: 50S ribosomal protein L15 [Planctomycetota bacterium]|nr:MAG: 50S ribosomal protein L15 [Planctomycetota bacterium]